MKILISTIFGVLAALGTVSVLSSCTHGPKIDGTWQAAPERLAIAGVADAYSTVTLDFAPLQSKNSPGQVDISAVIEVQQASPASSHGVNSTWETSVTATASATGTYAYVDDDELVLTIDPSSLSVNVDPNDVVYTASSSALMEASQIDSLSAAATNRWRLLLTPAVREQMLQYRMIDDIKIHHGNMMSVEINNRETTLHKTTPI